MIYSIQELISSLKAAREQKRISQHELANKVGVPQSHISKIENGNVNIRLSSFIQLARTLELEVLLVPRQDVTLIRSIINSKNAERDGGYNSHAYVPDRGDEDF